MVPMYEIRKGEKQKHDAPIWNNGYKHGESDAIDRVLEIVDKHVTMWSGKRYGDPAIMAALADVQRDVKALMKERGVK